MSVPAAPKSLGTGGRVLWEALATDGMGEHLVVLLTEACRARDRLDQLDRVLRGDAETWMRLTHKTQTNDYELKIDAALTQANSTAGVMKGLLEKIPVPAAEPAKGGTGGDSNGGGTALDQLAARREKRPGPAAAGADGKSTRARTSERRRQRKD